MTEKPLPAPFLFDMPAIEVNAPSAPLPVAENAISRHASGDYEHDPLDWYVEEPWCIHALLAAIPFVGSVLDPACGGGRIVEACRSRGFDAVGSDLVDRGYPHCTPRVDFTLPGAWPDDSFDNVISNPPYYSGKGPVAYVDAALRVARHRVAVLVNLPFLASQGRYRWYKSRPLSHVLILSCRPSMPPGHLLGLIKQKGGKEDYVWLVFTRGHQGRAEVDFLMPEVRP